MPRTSSTTNSESAGHFGLRCLLFFTPLLAALGLTLVMLQRAGELYTPDEIVEIQARSAVLSLPEFHNWGLYFPRFHFVGARSRRPRVLVFGSSRAKTVRSEFFRRPSEVFNAGIPATETVGAFQRFLAQLPDNQLPDHVLIDLDPWWFRQAATLDVADDFMRPYSTLEIIDFAWRRGFWWSLKELRHPVAEAPDYLGVQGKRERSGLRPDGSLYLSKREPDETAAEITQKLRDGVRPFFHDTEELSPLALRELSRFLRFCQLHHVKVIGYTSSLKPSYFRPMRSDHRLDYYWKVPGAVKPLFEETGNEFHDFLDPDLLGCSDSQFLDPMHEAETCTLRLLTALSARSEAMAELVDTEHLQVLLAHRLSDWELDR